MSIDKPIPDADLPAVCRREAARLRQEANRAEAVEMRTVLLDAAKRFEQMAAEIESGPGED